MKAKHRKILTAIFRNPVNGNMEWSKIESLLGAIGCRTIEGAGSSVTFEKMVFVHIFIGHILLKQR